MKACRRLLSDSRTPAEAYVASHHNVDGALVGLRPEAAPQGMQFVVIVDEGPAQYLDSRTNRSELDELEVLSPTVGLKCIFALFCICICLTHSLSTNYHVVRKSVLRLLDLQIGKCFVI